MAFPDIIPTTHGPLGSRPQQVQRILTEVAEWPGLAERFPHTHDILRDMAPALGRLTFLLDRILDGAYHVDNPSLTDAAILAVFKTDVSNLLASAEFFREVETTACTEIADRRAVKK